MEVQPQAPIMAKRRLLQSQKSLSLAYHSDGYLYIPTADEATLQRVR